MQTRLSVGAALGQHPEGADGGGGNGYLSSTARAAVGTARVLELFQTTPPSWIRPLLTLTSPVDGHGGRGRPAFELGRAEPVDGAVAVPLPGMGRGAGSPRLQPWGGRAPLAPKG